jgi:hypothetical protein
LSEVKGTTHYPSARGALYYGSFGKYGIHVIPEIGDQVFPLSRDTIPGRLTSHVTSAIGEITGRPSAFASSCAAPPSTRPVLQEINRTPWPLQFGWSLIEPSS